MRLFVAVPLPETVRRRIVTALRSLAGEERAVRWVAEPHLHLTVRFLGDVEAERASAVAAALERGCRGAKPFPVPVQGFGAFPSAAEPRVLWAGLAPVPPLELLHDGIERALAAVDFPVEGRPFRPHVTIGRVRRGRRAGPLAARLVTLPLEDTMVVDRVELTESRPGGAGPAYTVRHRVPLEG